VCFQFYLQKPPVLYKIDKTINNFNAECRMNSEFGIRNSEYYRDKAQRSGFGSERRSNVAERMPEHARAEQSGVCDDDDAGLQL